MGVDEVRVGGLVCFEGVEGSLAFLVLNDGKNNSVADEIFAWDLRGRLCA